MKKQSFPIWNFISVFSIIIFFLGFYLNGKFILNLTWSKDWIRVGFWLIVIYFCFSNAGSEQKKISDTVEQNEKIKTNVHNALYEYIKHSTKT